MSKLLRAALSIAALATSLIGGGAHAAIYSSHFDPLGDVTFAGEGTFYVDDICLAGTAVRLADTCHARLIGADVDLTLTATSDTGHLDFGPSTNLFSIVIVNGELVGVNSGQIGSVLATTCTGVVCDMPWWIQWESDAFDPVFLYTGSCGYQGPSLGTQSLSTDCTAFPEPAGAAFDVTFTRVPEPGSLALLAAGLVAAFGVRRRRTGR